VKRIPYNGPNNGDLDVVSNLQMAGTLFPEVSNDQGNENNDTWRAKLAYFPNNDWTISLTADYVRVRENQNASSLIRTNAGPTSLAGLYNVIVAGEGPPVDVPANVTQSLIGKTPYDDRFVTGDPFTTYATSPGGTKIESWGTTLNIAYDISNSIRFKSITGYRNLQSTFGEDADQSPLLIQSHLFVSVNTASLLDLWLNYIQVFFDLIIMYSNN